SGGSRMSIDVEEVRSRGNPGDGPDQIETGTSPVGISACTDDVCAGLSIVSEAQRLPSRLRRRVEEDADSVYSATRAARVDCPSADGHRLSVVEHGAGCRRVERNLNARVW